MGNLCASGTREKPKSSSKAKAGPTSNGQATNGKTVDGPTHKALKHLGGGTAAETWLFEVSGMTKPVAIKMFKRPITDLAPEAVQNEIQVQSELGPGHINLISVHTLFLSADCLGLVMEYAQRGSLATWIQAKKPLPNGLVMDEDYALYLFRQLVSAVAYIHAHGIAHRDLKLDNTLLDGSDPPLVKICDFGFAKHCIGPHETCQSQLGTMEYMSPEILHKSLGGKDDTYDARKADLWAVGIILVVFLCGSFPFDSMDNPHSTDKEEDLWRTEISSKWKESKHVARKIEHLSPELIDLVDQILVVKPEDRITIEAIKQHEWYNRKLPSKYQKALDDIQEQQRGLEKHVSNQVFDKKKMAARSQQIAAMVEKATKAGEAGGKRVSTSVREPEYAFNMGSSRLQLIDLGHSAVESNTRSPSEAKIVRDRFDRVSVAQAVQTAFEGDARKELSDAAKYRTN